MNLSMPGTKNHFKFTILLTIVLNDINFLTFVYSNLLEYNLFNRQRKNLNALNKFYETRKMSFHKIFILIDIFTVFILFT